MPDLWLLFAPIKRGRIDWLVEKATELGVARLVPVLTRRTIVDRLNLDRLRAHAIEAAEQCERTALPELAEPAKLDALLEGWPADRTLYFADEAGGEPFAPAPGPAAILIGPEGGFTEEERAAIRALPQARPVSLGPASCAPTPPRSPPSRCGWRARGIGLRRPLAAKGRDDDPHRHRPRRPRHREPRRSARGVRGGREAARGVADRHRAREVRLSLRRPSRALL